MEFLYYCRSGYEADLLAELDQKCAEKGHYGYAKLHKHSAHLRYNMPQLTLPNAKASQELSLERDRQAIASKVADFLKLSQATPKFDDLVFARQKLVVISELHFETANRVEQVQDFLLDALQMKDGHSLFSALMVEHFDTEDSKQMAKFCKKFTVPLRSNLRKTNILNVKPDNTKPYLHLIFNDSQSCIIAISFAKDRSEHALGIFRLKMPSDAPSRSTLKLEEAIKGFLTPKQEQCLFTPGMRAVDLGACPGGWTYQLVQRKITVEAVDHGEIDAKLMATGLVEYYPQDGFLYKPKEGNVNWLVCDMIEQPTRVSELMLAWLLSGKANAAVFNLKLPMNKRHKVVEPILEKLKSKLQERFGKVVVKAKHLYHNRDEISVMVIVNSAMLEQYHANR